MGLPQLLQPLGKTWGSFLIFLEELRGLVGQSALCPVCGHICGALFPWPHAHEARVYVCVCVGGCLYPIGHQTAGHVGDHTCVLLNSPGQQVTPPGNLSLGSLHSLWSPPCHPCPPGPEVLPQTTARVPRGAGPLPSTPMSPQTQGPTPSTHLRPETQAGLGRERLYDVAMDTSTQKGRGCLLPGASWETPDQGPPPYLGGWSSLKEKL